MAVSKRLRFEILRRDGFRCYYCGTRGNETTNGLTIDHVTPTALGGSDLPSNLVSACSDCNAGKSATSLDSETVAGLTVHSSAAADERRSAVEKAATTVDTEHTYLQDVLAAWRSHAPSYVQFPGDGFAIVDRWFADGIALSLIDKAFAITWNRRSIAKSARLRYAAGVVRHLVDEAGGS